MIKTDNPQVNSNLSAAISHLMVAYSLLRGEPDLRNNAQLRRNTERDIHDLIEKMQPDYNDWPYVRDQFEFYDQYLGTRREAGEITDFDLIRPGMLKVNFSSEVEYWEHMRRHSDHQKNLASGDGAAMKTCGKCGLTKPKYNFRATGATCNSCRARAYRQRKGAPE